MAGEHREFQSRLIVTGLDADGRSIIRQRRSDD